MFTYITDIYQIKANEVSRSKINILFSRLGSIWSLIGRHTGLSGCSFWMNFDGHVSNQSFSWLRSVICLWYISVVSQVSAGSVVQWCAGGGSCCDEEGRGGRGSEESGLCTEVRGCSTRMTDTWPPQSAASPPSSEQRSPSLGCHSPGKQECLLLKLKCLIGGSDDRQIRFWYDFFPNMTQVGLTTSDKHRCPREANLTIENRVPIVNPDSFVCWQLCVANWASCSSCLSIRKRCKQPWHINSLCAN